MKSNILPTWTLGESIKKSFSRVQSNKRSYPFYRKAKIVTIYGCRFAIYELNFELCYMKKSFAILILLSLVTPLLVFGVTDQINISQQITGEAVVCDNDGICEPERGETESNCPSDCGCNYNGICEPERLENYENCPSDCPAPAPAPTPGTVLIIDTTPPTIYNLLISKITLNSVIIAWDSTEQTICQLYWGRTKDYEEGIIAEDAFYWSHSTKITNLSPATSYHFKISCRDSAKNESETEDQEFTTLSPPDTTPANISNFEAIPGDRKITLKWQNPPDLDFKEVKIFRSTEFYPSHPWEGISIYIGQEQSFEDTGLTNEVTYYYTAFSYDKAGNYSLGAIVSATPQAPPVPPVKPPIKPPAKPPVKPPVVPPLPEVEKLKLEDFGFWQKEERLPIVEENKIKLKEKEPLTISIDYEKVPEVLKTIMVTLEKENKYFSFLLRINREKTKYLATLPSPQPGVYPFTIYVLDFKNQTLKTMTGELKVEKTEVEKPEILIPWYKNLRFWLYILMGVIVTGMVGYILKRRKSQKIS